MAMGTYLGMLVGPTVRLGTSVVSSIRLTGLLLSRPNKPQADVDVEASPFILRSFPNFKSKAARRLVYETDPCATLVG